MKHETFGKAQNMIRAKSLEFSTVSPIFYIHYCVPFFIQIFFSQIIRSFFRNLVWAFANINSFDKVLLHCPHKDYKLI